MWDRIHRFAQSQDGATGVEYALMLAVVSAGVIPAAMALVARIEQIVSAVQQLKQVYDGKNTYSSIQGFSLPPVTSLGFPLLPRVGDKGYAISALDGKKKQRGFRITTPEGFYTDFIVDEKTNQIKGYESAYDVGGRIVTPESRPSRRYNSAMADWTC